MALTTKLDAVNTMLEVIGESPINSLINEANQDVTVALHVLETTNRAVQATGWYWNTESDFVLTRDSNNRIPLSENILKVDSMDKTKNIIALGGRFLYDADNHTFFFNDNVKAVVVWLRDFEEAPEVARQYITIRAARQFQKRVIGSHTLDVFTQEDEIRALGELKRLEDENGDYNFMNRFYLGR